MKEWKREGEREKERGRGSQQSEKALVIASQRHRVSESRSLRHRDTAYLKRET